MDETNRAGAIVLALLLMFFALLVILLTWGAPDESIEAIADLAGWLEDNNNTATQLVITFGALIFLLLGLAVVIFELMPPQTGLVKVAKVGAGEARIGTDEVGRRLEDELRSVPRLRGVEARVTSHGPRAGVKLDLFVDTEADVTQVANEAIQRTRDTVETRMGVELDAPPSAEVHYADSRSSKAGTASRAGADVQPAADAPSWRPAASSDAVSTAGQQPRTHSSQRPTHKR